MYHRSFSYAESQNSRILPHAATVTKPNRTIYIKFLCRYCVLYVLVRALEHVYSEVSFSNTHIRILPRAHCSLFYFVAFVIENDFHMICGVVCAYYFEIYQANRQCMVRCVSFWSRFSHYNIKMMALGILLISNKTPMLAKLGSVTVHEMNETKNTAT